MSELLNRISLPRRRFILSGAAGLAAGLAMTADSLVRLPPPTEPVDKRLHGGDIDELIDAIVKNELQRSANHPEDGARHVRLVESAGKVLTGDDAKTIKFPDEGKRQGILRYAIVTLPGANLLAAISATVQKEVSSDYIHITWVNDPLTEAGRIRYSKNPRIAPNSLKGRNLSEDDNRKWYDNPIDFDFLGEKTLKIGELDQVATILEDGKVDRFFMKVSAKYFTEINAKEFPKDKSYQPQIRSSTPTPTPRPTPYWIPTPTIPYILPYKDKA